MWSSISLISLHRRQVAPAELEGILNKHPWVEEVSKSTLLVGHGSSSQVVRCRLEAQHLVSLHTVFQITLISPISPQG